MFDNLSYTSKSILICQRNINSALLDCKITKSSFSGLSPTKISIHGNHFNYRTSALLLFFYILPIFRAWLLSLVAIMCMVSLSGRVIRFPQVIWLLVPELCICHFHHGQENTVFSTEVLCCQVCPPWLSSRVLPSKSARGEEEEMWLFSHPA